MRESMYKIQADPAKCVQQQNGEFHAYIILKK
jgi:hypothetical protein